MEKEKIQSVIAQFNSFAPAKAYAVSVRCSADDLVIVVGVLLMYIRFIDIVDITYPHCAGTTNRLVIMLKGERSLYVVSTGVAIL